MRILIIEDEHNIAGALKRGFEQENYEVELAFNGRDGFEQGLSEEFDLIVLDLMLPGMDGVSVCRKLREAKVETPILMLTAKGQVSDRVLGLNAGADDYLGKPFSFEELLARIRAISRRPKLTTATLLSIKNLKLDPIGLSVMRGNKTISLSSREFSLLEYFLRHKGQILSKEKIIANVWEYDSDILPNTVEAFIKSLRKKIDLPHSHTPSLITTVRGFGYKIG